MTVQEATNRVLTLIVAAITTTAPEATETVEAEAETLGIVAAEGAVVMGIGVGRGGRLTRTVVAIVPAMLLETAAIGAVLRPLRRIPIVVLLALVLVTTAVPMTVGADLMIVTGEAVQATAWEQGPMIGGAPVIRTGPMTAVVTTGMVLRRLLLATATTVSRRGGGMTTGEAR